MRQEDRGQYIQNHYLACECQCRTWVRLGFGLKYCPVLRLHTRLSWSGLVWSGPGGWVYFYRGLVLANAVIRVLWVGQCCVTLICLLQSRHWAKIYKEKLDLTRSCPIFWPSLVFFLSCGASEYASLLFCNSVGETEWGISLKIALQSKMMSQKSLYMTNLFLERAEIENVVQFLNISLIIYSICAFETPPWWVCPRWKSNRSSFLD